MLLDLHFNSTNVGAYNLVNFTTAPKELECGHASYVAVVSITHFCVFIGVNLDKDGDITVLIGHLSEDRAGLLAGTAPGGKEVANDKRITGVS